jgi:hypothetical protein
MIGGYGMMLRAALMVGPSKSAPPIGKNRAGPHAPAFRTWLHALSLASLVVAVGCAALISGDETHRPQNLWIMNLDWPLTALFGSLIS